MLDDSFYSSLKLQLPGNAWPVIPGAAAATLLAMQVQLENSQWLSGKAIERLQFKQLKMLINFAVQNVSYYREKLQDIGDIGESGFGVEEWRQLPVLTRSDIQNFGKEIQAKSLPSKNHGPLDKLQTSGSTGMPSATLGTSVARLFWQAITLRDHLWHKRDLKKKLVAIRPEGDRQSPDGVDQDGWGPATDSLFNTGNAATLNSSFPVHKQAAWLIRRRAPYVLSLPSNVVELARHFANNNEDLPGLEQIRTYGEVANEEVYKICKEVWNVPVIDMYSPKEAGYIALQCPVSNRYHVQSESLLVEVIDDHGHHCKPGETGQVVVTTLHNFAMPLIRYALGDYAEVGEACPCGRGLAVLNKVLGRERNMLTLASGSRHYPSFPAESRSSIAPIKQIQLVQKSVDHN